ncbi:MAG: Uma2 family endonuclease [Egibacteraceae bacterium]
MIVVTAEAYERTEPSTYYWPDDVVLAVEAVSPDSKERDRDAKPRKYAAAGISHLWRVERADGNAVAYVCEHDPATAAYALTGIHHDRLVLQSLTITPAVQCRLPNTLEGR